MRSSGLWAAEPAFILPKFKTATEPRKVQPGNGDEKRIKTRMFYPSMSDVADGVEHISSVV
jgi:hypothetical protein